MLTGGPLTRALMPNAVFAATPVDRESVPKHRLDIARRVRTNPLRWKGQFSPQLVEELLRAYASAGSRIVDPFVGSGTSLGEAARLGLAASGSDLNPAAVVLARLYAISNLDFEERRARLRSVRSSLIENIGLPGPSLFVAARRRVRSRTQIEDGLVRTWRETGPGTERNLAAALVVLCDFFQPGLDLGAVHRTWSRIERVVADLPISERPVSIRHADARALPLESGAADLVVTSPPYINVHNYHQTYRRSVEALDCDVLDIARCEIGSNRHNRGNRFLTVIQYALDMTLALQEMARVTRCGGRLILVVGRESTVRGTRFFNGELVAELAVHAIGMSMDRRQERVFRNRYGADIVEDILHLRSPGAEVMRERALEAARGAARSVLEGAAPRVPARERHGLEDALARVSDLPPSPILEHLPAENRFDSIRDSSRPKRKPRDVRGPPAEPSAGAGYFPAFPEACRAPDRRGTACRKAGSGARMVLVSARSPRLRPGKAGRRTRLPSGGLRRSAGVRMTDRF